MLELAKQVVKVSGFTDRKRGITVNPGVVAGGSRSNVIAAEAKSQIDLRVSTIKDAKTMDKKFRSLKAFNKKCKLSVSGGINRPPLERSEKVKALFARRETSPKRWGSSWKKRRWAGGRTGILRPLWELAL